MIVAIVTLLTAIALGFPIIFVLGLAAAFMLLFTTDLPLALIAHRYYAGMNSFPIMAVPFFILAGFIMDAAGISRRIVELCIAMIGWMTGSLLQVAIFAATGLAAMSGSGTADTAAIASILTPELKKRKYDIDFALGVIATAGSHAQIIPPSLMMVIIGVANDLSIGALFLAGVLPGMLTVPALSLVAYLHAKRGGPAYQDPVPFSVKRLAITFWNAIPAIGMAVIILVGILGGFVTPTEASAIAAWYGLVVGLFIYKDLKFHQLPRIFLKAGGISCGLLALVGVGNIFGYLMAVADVPALMSEWIRATVSQGWTFMLLINIVFLILGCFGESIVYILVLSPVLIPIAQSFGIDPIHFSLVMVFNLVIGLITPPIGACLFVVSVVGQRTLLQLSRKLFWPFISMVVVLVLVTYIPELSLYLPRAAGFIR
ncbi:MAG: TRAP transporter large permease [Rhodospirillales bacterium]|nr:TRAP transporter large permease [Rhodospirillales bacterium]